MGEIPAASNGVGVTAQGQFELAREMVRHEDGLVNNRVTWWLVFQGFLFAAFVGGIGTFEKVAKYCGASGLLTVGLVILGLLGIVSSVTARNVLSEAFAQLNSIDRWWRAKESASDFPPL